MKVMIACGGSSGHINPAIAIADELRRRDPECDILFVGTPYQLEATLVPKAGYRIEFIEVYGFSRKKNLKAVFWNMRSLFKSLLAGRTVSRLLKRFKPDLVVGTGGFVSGSVVRTAARKDYKTAIHEQNSFAGVTTRLLAPEVDRIFLNLPLTKPFAEDIMKKCVITGNPANKKFFSESKESAKKRLGFDKPVALSYGGSLGATVIDKAFVEMAKLSYAEGGVIHVHGTPKNHKWVIDSLGNIADDENFRIYDYIYNMSEIMAASDVVIARTGAGTLSEIAALGKPSILIPSENVAENHQYYNAKVYEDAGAAVIITEKNLSGRVLFETLKSLLSNPERLQKMSQAALSLARPKATESVVDGLMDLLNS